MDIGERGRLITLACVFVIFLSLIKATDSSVGSCYICNGTLAECQDIDNSSDQPASCHTSPDQGDSERHCYAEVTDDDGNKRVEMGCEYGKPCDGTMAQLFDCINGNSSALCRACCSDDACNSLNRPTEPTTSEPSSSSTADEQATSDDQTSESSTPESSSSNTTVENQPDPVTSEPATSEPSSLTTADEQTTSDDHTSSATSSITPEWTTPEPYSTTLTATGQTWPDNTTTFVTPEVTTPEPSTTTTVDTQKSSTTSELSTSEPLSTTTTVEESKSSTITESKTSASTAIISSNNADSTSFVTSEVTTPEPSTTTTVDTQTSSTTSESSPSEPSSTTTTVEESKSSTITESQTSASTTIISSRIADLTSFVKSEVTTSEPSTTTTVDTQTSSTTSELSTSEPLSTTTIVEESKSSTITESQTSASTTIIMSSIADSTSFVKSEVTTPEPSTTTIVDTQTSSTTSESSTSEPSSTTTIVEESKSSTKTESQTSASTTIISSSIADSTSFVKSEVTTPEPSTTTIVDTQTSSTTSESSTSEPSSTTTIVEESKSSTKTESQTSASTTIMLSNIADSTSFVTTEVTTPEPLTTTTLDTQTSSTTSELSTSEPSSTKTIVEESKSSTITESQTPASTEIISSNNADSTSFVTSEVTTPEPSTTTTVDTQTSSTTSESSTPEPSSSTTTVIEPSSTIITESPTSASTTIISSNIAGLTSFVTSEVTTPEPSTTTTLDTHTSSTTSESSTSEPSSTTTIVEESKSSTITESQTSASTTIMSSNIADSTSFFTSEVTSPEPSTTTTVDAATSSITSESSTLEPSSTTTIVEESKPSTITESQTSVSTTIISSSIEDSTSFVTSGVTTPEPSITTTVDTQTSSITSESSTSDPSSSTTTVNEPSSTIKTESPTAAPTAIMTSTNADQTSFFATESSSLEPSSTTTIYVQSEIRLTTVSDTSASTEKSTSTAQPSTTPQTTTTTFSSISPVFSSAAATSPFSSFTSPLFSTTILTTSVRRNTSLSCLVCNTEPQKFCLTNELPQPCGSIDDVCFVTDDRGSGANSLTKGCKPRDVCQSLQSTNNPECQYGIVTDVCTWCCDDADECNRGINYLPTTSISTMATTTLPACDMIGYIACLDMFQKLVDEAATDPDILFNGFCGSVPSVFRCLATSMSDCNCLDSNFARLNQTLEKVLANMTSRCPSSCDPPTGFNCSMTFYLRLIDNLVDGINCDASGRIDNESERCRLKSTGSCDASVRDVLNVTYSAIRREWRSICFPSPPTVPPPDTTESSACDVVQAKQCIVDLGVDVVNYYNYGGDIGTLCSLLSTKENCYSKSSLTCSEYTRRGLDTAWNATKHLIADQCVAYIKPKCDTTRARSCILDLWRLVDEAKDFQAACSLQPVTVSCVAEQTAGCSLSDQQSLNRSLQIVIADIGNRCDNTVEVFPNATELYLQECGNGSEISYQFTGPPSSMCSSDYPNCRVFVEIDIEIGDNSNYPRCRNKKVIAQAVLVASNSTNSSESLCSREVTSSNWNIMQIVSIAAKLDFKYDGTQRRNLTVWLRMDDSSGTTYQRRSMRVYTLVISDCDTSAVCSSINDPHMTTFDGWYYNNFQEGFFILYRHMDLPAEVQIVTQRCNGAAACNCAVGVRSGDTVFFVDRCRKKSLIEKLKCGLFKYDCQNLMKATLYAHDRITPGTRMFSRNSGREFVVWLPHGTVVKITVNGDFLNVWITASPADWRSTQGLCGYYDRVSTNDLRLRDGSQSTGQGHGRGQQPTSFNDNWRATAGENVYTGVSRSPYSPASYCECRPNTTSSNTVVSSTCNFNMLLETCDWDSSGAEILFDSTLNNSPPSSRSPGRGRERRRRDVSDPLSDLDIDTTFVPDKTEVVDRAVAEANCTTFFNTMASAVSCHNAGVVADNSSLESCIDDIAITGSYSWMNAALESLKEKCVQELGRNASIPSNLASNILDSVCPNECKNPNGVCVNDSTFSGSGCLLPDFTMNWTEQSNRTCNCTFPFSGDDCSFSLNSSITFAEPVDDGLCDVRSSDCTRVQMLGLGFVPNVTSCSVQFVTLNGTLGAKSSTGLEFVSENEVHCMLGSTMSAIVTLSNSGSNSPSTLFTAYDAVCYSCLGNVSMPFPNCQRLPNSCIVNEICYGPGEYNTDQCLTCQPDKSNTSFSRSDSAGCSKSDNKVGLIIGLAVGLSTFVIVATIVIVSVVLYKRLYTASGTLSDGNGQPVSTDDIDGIYISPPPYDAPRDSVSILRISTDSYKLGVDNAYQLDEVAGTGGQSS